MSNFCSLPFTALHVHATGEAVPCCRFNPGQQISVDNYFTNIEIHQVKQAFLSNQWPQQCRRCQQDEEQIGHSLRVMSERFESHEQEIKQINRADYFNIVELNVGTSNVCNLQCLPCEHASFVRDVELVELGLRTAQPIRQINPSLDQLARLTSIQRLTVLGGEPFADRVTMEFLDQLIDQGTSQQIRLDINTNLTRVNRDQLTRLQDNFKELVIKGSIDGIGAYNEYLRWPSQWPDVESSVDLIQELNIPFLLITALSNLALLRYDQVLTWATGRGIVDCFVPLVNTPSVLAYTRLPESIKQQLRPRYELLKDSATDRTASAITACANILATPGCTDTEWSETVHWLELHDQRRGTNFKQLWPELND